MAPNLARLLGRPSFVNYATNNNTATTVAISAPANSASTDLILAIAASTSGSDADWTVPAGFTEETDPTTFIDMVTMSGLQSNVGNASTSGSSTKASLSLAFRNARKDAVATRGLTSAVSLVLPELTISQPGLLIALVAADVPGRVITPPAGMTLIGESVPGATYPHLVAYSENVEAGATGTRTFTLNNVVGDAGGQLFGIIRA